MLDEQVFTYFWACCLRFHFNENSHYLYLKSLIKTKSFFGILHVLCAVEMSRSVLSYQAASWHLPSQPLLINSVEWNACLSA